MSEIIPFPIPARSEDPVVVCRGAGTAVAVPVASRPGRAALTPGQRVSVAYRFAYRGARRCAAGDDLGAGYRLGARAHMAGLVQTMGPVRAADYLMQLAYEAAAPILEGPENDDGPRAA